jgi:hypothetical protein
MRTLANLSDRELVDGFAEICAEEGMADRPSPAREELLRRLARVAALREAGDALASDALLVASNIEKRFEANAMLLRTAAEGWNAAKEATP